MQRVLIALTLATPLALASAPVFAQVPMAERGAHFMEQWDADADGRVTAAEVKTKRGEVFYMFDAEADGSLGADDWAMVQEHMEQELGEGGQDQSMRAQMQAQGQAMGQGQGQGKGKGMGQGQGQGMGQGMGQQGGTPEKGANMAPPGVAIHDAMTIGFNDADGDGQVTLAEFDAASDRLFPMLDADGDGAVTAADFGRP